MKVNHLFVFNGGGHCLGELRPKTGKAFRPARCRNDGQFSRGKQPTKFPPNEMLMIAILESKQDDCGGEKANKCNGLRSDGNRQGIERTW
jgi:hypothetical protein